MPGSAAVATLTYGPQTITATIVAAPVESAAPAISGTPQVGETLTMTSNGSWTAYPAPAYSYQWESCSGNSCMPISGATASMFTLSSAQAGEQIKLQVTATNGAGSTSAESNSLGPVTQAPASNPQSTSNSQTSTTPAPTPALPSLAKVSSALYGIGHPSGTKATAELIKHSLFSASFNSPSAGSLKVVWTAVVKTDTSSHNTRKKVTVATGSGHAGGAQKLQVAIRLTAGGKALLERTPHDLQITATESFQPTSDSSTTVTKHFNL
jgi:hypothetical protein